MCEIARQACGKGIGARGIHAVVEELMQELLYEIPSDPSIETCIVTRDTVRGTKPPVVKYKEEVRSAKDDSEGACVEYEGEALAG